MGLNRLHTVGASDDITILYSSLSVLRWSVLDTETDKPDKPVISIFGRLRAFRTTTVSRFAAGW